MGLFSTASLLLLFLSGTLACQNGGLQVGATCHCPPMWTGDNCETILCINGGYPGANNRCVCPTGYMGVHCDAVTTFRRPKNAFSQPESSFNLVMVNVFSQYCGGLVVSQFQKAINNHLVTVSTKNAEYKHLNLVTNANAPQKDSNLSAFDFSFSSSDYNREEGLPLIQGPGTYKCYPIPFYQSIINLIQQKSLRETAITIITQHPPQSESDVYNRLIELATSFDIRINVIWSGDDTFVRCQPSDTQKLMDLAAKTGGMFVQAMVCSSQIENYDETNTIMDVILASHFRYEAVTMDYGTTPSVSFRMNLPYTKNYYVVALSDDGQATNVSWTTSACNSIQSSVVPSGAFAQAYSFTPLQSICSVRATTDQGKARLHVFASDLFSGPISVRLYKSYVEATNYQIDTSNTQPDQGNSLYLTLHVENNIPFIAAVTSAKLRSEDGPNLDIQISNRDKSVFETYSNESVVCQTQLKMWIELSLASTSASGFFPETRFIPIYCVEKTKPKAEAVVKSWWSEIEDRSKLQEDFVYGEAETSCGPDNNQARSLILAYSDMSDKLQYNTYILAAIPPTKYPQFGDYGEVRFDVNTSLSSPSFNSQKGDYIAFQHAVYTKYPPNETIAFQDVFEYSQILEALKLIAESPDVQQNSLVTVMLTRFPDSSTDLKPFYPLVNKNVKVVFFMDINDLNYQVWLNKNGYGDILNRIAAITGGHFIVSDQSNRVSFNTILTNVYTLGAGQNLLFSKNIQKPKNEIIGQIDLSNVPEDVKITVTLSTAVSGNSTETTSIVYQPQVYFVTDEGTVSARASLGNSTGGVGNYYSGTTVLPAGAKYSVKVVSLMTTKQTLLRVWSTNTIKTDVQVAYKSLNDATLAGPNDWDGAALGVNLQDATDAKSMSLAISDCSGNPITLYDSVQSFTISGCHPVHFVPFFCSLPTDTSKCQPGTENLYFAQITTKMAPNVTGFVGVKSFMCDAIGKGVKAGCNNKDGQGNYICGGNKVPYIRGPSGLLIDCSDPSQSLLKYDNSLSKTSPLAPYTCQCPGGTQEGESCQKATCSPQNTDGGAVDSQYRTYSVVVGVDKGFADYLKYLFEDASKILLNKEDNIWQYQLFATCYYGDMIPLYIGTDYSSFSDAFTNAAVTCNTTLDAADFDLTETYRSVLSSVGRQQRGLVVFFHELSQNSISKNTVAVNDLEAFIKLAQQYKQQLYIYNVYDDAPSTVSDSLTNAVMMTGGAVITVSQDNFHTQFFNATLSQSTSLNAHAPVFNGTSSVTMDADGYLIVGSKTGDLTTSGVYNNCDSKDTINDKFTVICSVTSGRIISLSNLPSDAWYSVVSSSNAPVAVFIGGRTDDRSTAFAVNYTVGGPTLAVAAPDGWTVNGNTDTNARSAQRNGCTFVETTVNVFNTLQEGYSSITLTMQNGSTTVNKVIPFGVSSSIACANGNANGDKYGLCRPAANWSGPDNSIPVCKGGDLSTWSNACNCRSSGKIGQFCEKDAPSEEATTVIATTTMATAEQLATTTV